MSRSYEVLMEPVHDILYLQGNIKHDADLSIEVVKHMS